MKRCSRSCLCMSLGIPITFLLATIAVLTGFILVRMAENSAAEKARTSFSESYYYPMELWDYREECTTDMLEYPDEVWWEPILERNDECIACDYYWDEALNPRGASTCDSDCDCGSSRICSEFGWCHFPEYGEVCEEWGWDNDGVEFERYNEPIADNCCVFFQWEDFVYHIRNSDGVEEGIS